MASRKKVHIVGAGLSGMVAAINLDLMKNYVGLDLPDPTIIATGLFRKMNEFLGRPLVRLPCFSARKVMENPELEGDIRTWFGRYTNTYAYASIINQLDPERQRAR
jgi:hypothetical protein